MKIRHTIRGWPTVPGITPRRLAASRRALHRERERLALFADQVAAEQETPEERIARFDLEFLEYDQGHRDLAAKYWRWARRKLSELADDVQAELIDRWNRSWVPKRAEYFAGFVRTELRRRSRPE